MSCTSTIPTWGVAITPDPGAPRGHQHCLLQLRKNSRMGIEALGHAKGGPRLGAYRVPHPFGGFHRTQNCARDCDALCDVTGRGRRVTAAISAIAPSRLRCRCPPGSTSPPGARARPKAKTRTAAQILSEERSLKRRRGPASFCVAPRVPHLGQIELDWSEVAVGGFDSS